jgi:hypothetical protein
VKLYLIRVDPVQQVAAHPDTLELLMKQLKEHAGPAPSGPAGSSLLGWPLVPDPAVPRQIVYLRPHPQPAPHAEP